MRRSKRKRRPPVPIWRSSRANRNSRRLKACGCRPSRSWPRCRPCLSPRTSGKKSDGPYPIVHIYGAGDAVRIASTNGHQAFIFAWQTKEPPSWIETGISLPQDGLGDRIKVIDKVAPAPAGEQVVDICWGTDAPYATVSDPGESAIFRVFPDKDRKWPAAHIQKIIDGLKFGAKQTIDLHSMAFSAGYVKGAAAMAATLGSKTIRMFATTQSGKDPVLFDFPGCPGAILVLMPGSDDQQIAPMTASLLEAPVAGTVAALRAHRTRWTKKMEKAAGDRAKRTIQSKIEEYDQRIDAILGRTRTALPAPPTPPEVDGEDQVQDAPEGFDEHAADGPIGFVPQTPSPAKMSPPSVSEAEAAAKSAELLAGQRARFRGAARDKALTRFSANVNAVLSKEHSLTLSQLADGVPIESWFDAGLAPAAAAQRCLSWRYLSTAPEQEESQEAAE